MYLSSSPASFLFDVIECEYCYPAANIFHRWFTLFEYFELDLLRIVERALVRIGIGAWGIDPQNHYKQNEFNYDQT